MEQAWSSSVNSRSSIIVIHSGNYEIVCLRHRKSQTLYISDILHVPFLEAPSYSKVQTGLYIAAVEDTLARNKVDRAHGLVPTWTPPAVPDRPSKRPKVVEQLHGDVSVSHSSIQGVVLTWNTRMRILFGFKHVSVTIW